MIAILLGVTRALTISVIGVLMLLPAGVSGDAPPPGVDAACAAVGTAVDNLLSRHVPVRYGFYTDFQPLSYAANQDPGDPAFDVPLGYEPDLISAITTLSNDLIQFVPGGIGNPFSGIWLLSADERFDMVGGGITALDERRFHPPGATAARVTFGVGHVRFRQSLLVRNDSAIVSHDDLDDSTTVGVLRGTTGESRLLRLAGITDEEGYLPSATVIALADKATLVTGERTHRITASGATSGIETRIRLQAPGVEIPPVVYLASDDAQIAAVTNGSVDAIARGEVGNLIAARDSGGALRVVAIDHGNVEYGAFSYPNTADGDSLRSGMDHLLNCLTDNGNIGFAQWHEDAQVFQRRAARHARFVAPAPTRP